MDSLLPSDPVSIDGYVIEGRLGSGGFGIVYGATSPDGRPVAVKVLRPELSDDLRLRERLAREADALSRVEGERTAEIFEVVTEGDLVYLVMEIIVDGIQHYSTSTTFLEFQLLVTCNLDSKFGPIVAAPLVQVGSLMSFP